MEQGEIPEYTIEKLSPILEILDYACSSDVVIKPIYNRFLQIQIPILIGLATGFDYCFSGVIRICQSSSEEIRYCPGYESLTVKCQPTSARFLIYLVDLNFEGYPGSFRGRHAEAVIIDTQEKTIEFFEPNGPSAPWYSLAIRHLPKWQASSSCQDALWGYCHPRLHSDIHDNLSLDW